MKDYEDMTHAEREAWFAERLQQQSDDTQHEQTGDRLWIGLGIMALVVVAVLVLNWWLPVLGYGA